MLLQIFFILVVMVIELVRMTCDLSYTVLAKSLEISHISKVSCSAGNLLNQQLQPVDRNRFYSKGQQEIALFPNEVHVNPVRYTSIRSIYIYCCIGR